MTKNSILSWVHAHHPRTTVVAVSKLQPLEKIRALHESDQHFDFGENYMQEAEEKIAQLKDLQLRFHFIGHLQTNKCKAAVGRFFLIHSVDSLRLAQKLNQASMQQSQVTEVCLQVNLAAEVSKGGWLEADFFKDIEALTQLSHLKIRGLMTMPPLDCDEATAKKYFHGCHSLQQKIVSDLPSCELLSMGTSHDYKWALDAGATHIRLGSVLFGERMKTPSVNLG